MDTSVSTAAAKQRGRAVASRPGRSSIPGGWRRQCRPGISPWTSAAITHCPVLPARSVAWICRPAGDRLQRDRAVAGGRPAHQGRPSHWPSGQVRHERLRHGSPTARRAGRTGGTVQVGGQGDLGADVKATDPFGRRWVIQCKHRRNGSQGAAVGTPELQVLNGTGRPVHKADVVVMVTNGRITQPGRAFASQQRLHLVDRQVLAQWAAGSRPLWELLGAVPPPRRPAARS
ncbi:restriction endonuclease [Streptomyces sp. NPDC085931]|uniref:restriction endonuclease n=1 Tax=Streptomyces sp. NPDC085931 TaxID=3365740 RepID=UPI0037D5BCC6